MAMNSIQPTKAITPVILALFMTLIMFTRPATAESIQFVIEAARDTTSEYVAMPLARTPVGNYRTSAAVPGSRVTVHPVGWGREATADLTNLLAQDLETIWMA